MDILGISVFYHDSAACLVQDGKIVSAAQEERFTRKKHDFSFPINAITYCLKNSGLKAADLNYIAFYDKPFPKFERILETYLAFAPLGIRSFVKAVPLWIKQKLWIKDLICKTLSFDGPIVFPEHHESHAGSAFFPSPFQEAAFLTIDGVGEWTTTSYGIGKDNNLTILADIHFPHSLGLLYSAFTYHTGFKVNSGEYKVMGLAPYGEPRYKDLILNELMDSKEDGSFSLNMKYFNYCAGLGKSTTKPNLTRKSSGPLCVRTSAGQKVVGWFLPAPKTIFSHIKKLLPAHYLLFTGRGLTCHRYWNVREFFENQQIWRPEEYQDQIRYILCDSVKKRMISDVPLGAFLSGGLDSSTIVAMMAGCSAQPVKTFSIGFDSDEYKSELEHANTIARTFTTDHHERILSAQKLLELLPKLAWFMDEPFADHSIVPTYLVSQLARENVTVALSGDGADENLGGYPGRYLFAKRYNRYLQLPGFARNAAEGLFSKLLLCALWFMPENKHRMRLLKLNDMLGTESLMKIITLHTIVHSNLKKKLLHHDIRQQINPSPTITFSEYAVTGNNFVEQVLALDIENYLVNDILTKVDRMSMANSLEVRVPFLDHRLVELAAAIPSALKIHNKTTKYIMKNAVRDLLPQAIIDRKKQGFGIPVVFWMRKDLMKFTRQILLDPRVKKRNMLNVKRVEHMMETTSNGKCNYARELWTLLMLELWCCQFLD